MPYKHINTGTGPGDKGAERVYDGFVKAREMLKEIYENVPFLVREDIGFQYVGGLQFRVYARSYRVNGIDYNATPTSRVFDLELSPLDKRWYVFYADIDGNIGVAQGAPAVEPVKPNLSGSQRYIGEVQVNSTEERPINFETEIVFSEGPLGADPAGEWEPIGDGAEIYFTATEEPYAGYRHIRLFARGAPRQLYFRRDAPFSASRSINMLDFYVKIRTYTETTGFTVGFRQGPSNIGAAKVFSRSIGFGTVGFDPTMVGVWQHVTVNVENELAGKEWDGLYFGINPDTHIDFDEITVSSGSSTAQGPPQLDPKSLQDTTNVGASTDKIIEVKGLRVTGAPAGFVVGADGTVVDPADFGGVAIDFADDLESDDNTKVLSGRAGTVIKNLLAGKASQDDLNALNSILGRKLESTEAQLLFQAYTKIFTQEEKDKLATFDSNLDLGGYETLEEAELQNPDIRPGSRVYIDQGEGVDAKIYHWDATDGKFVLFGSGGVETPASIRTKLFQTEDLFPFDTAAKNDITSRALKSFVDAEFANKLDKTGKAADSSKLNGKPDTAFYPNVILSTVTDMDAFTVSGKFLLSAGALANSPLGSQTNSRPFIAVDNFGSYILQRFIDRTGSIWTRYAQSGAFGPWERTAFSSEIATKLQGEKADTALQPAGDASNLKNLPKEPFTSENIKTSSASNKRIDQSSMIRLDDGRLLVGYSNFGSGSGDTDESSVHYSTSIDNGNTWQDQGQLIAKIALGSYIPSFFKLANGNVLCLFFVRESDSPYTSTIRRIVFSADFTSTVTAQTTVLSGGYYPIASDRIFQDGTRLLMPYPKLMAGPGTSLLSTYQGGLLVSADNGVTWSNTSIAIDGKKDIDGYGGCLEPGIFQNSAKLTYYFRTTVGAIYAVDLTYSGGNYSAGASYHLGMQAQNAASTVKYVAEIDLFVGVYTKLNGDPRTYDRKIIEMSISKDGKKWKAVSEIANANRNGVLVNEPNIFIDIANKDIKIAYSIAPQSGYYDLFNKRINYSTLANNSGNIDSKLVSVNTNPTGADAIQIAESKYEIDKYDSNSYGNLLRSYLTVKGTVTNAIGSFYNAAAQLNLIGSEGEETDYLTLGALSNYSSQVVVDNIKVKLLTHFSQTNLTSNSVKNGAIIEEYIVLYNYQLISPTLTPNGTITEKWYLRSDGVDDQSAHMGNFGFGLLRPTEKVDVAGNVKTDSLILKAQARPASPKLNQMIINSTTKAIEYYDGTVWKNADGTNA